ERLRSINVEAVVVSRGVFQRSGESAALPLELSAQVVVWRGAERKEVRRSAGSALHVVGDVVYVRRKRFVAEVIVAPGPGSIQQPRRSQRTVVAHDKVACAVLQF